MKIKIFLLAFLLVFLFTGCNVNDIPQNEDPSQEISQEDNSQEEETENTEETENAEDTQSEVTIMYITINSNQLEVQLEQNTSVEALVEILKQGDIIYTVDDYGNFEKVGSLGVTLPRNDERITTQAGDVILYQGNSLCLYYGVNTWSFTRIGKINGYTDEQLKTLLCAGSGSIQVKLSINGGNL